MHLYIYIYIFIYCQDPGLQPETDTANEDGHILSGSAEYNIEYIYIYIQHNYAGHCTQGRAPHARHRWEGLDSENTLALTLNPTNPKPLNLKPWIEATSEVPTSAHGDGEASTLASVDPKPYKPETIKP